MNLSTRTTTMRNAQRITQYFAARNGWKNVITIDRFDHMHEELIEMSQHLRYKSEAERVKYLKAHKHIFADGVGDLMFSLCRLADQLGVDIEEAFNRTKFIAFKKYPPGPEINKTRKRKLARQREQ